MTTTPIIEKMAKEICRINGCVLIPEMLDECETCQAYGRHIGGAHAAHAVFKAHYLQPENVTPKMKRAFIHEYNEECGPQATKRGIAAAISALEE